MRPSLNLEAVSLVVKGAMVLAAAATAATVVFVGSANSDEPPQAQQRWVALALADAEPSEGEYAVGGLQVQATDPVQKDVQKEPCAPEEAFLEPAPQLELEPIVATGAVPRIGDGPQEPAEPYIEELDWEECEQLNPS